MANLDDDMGRLRRNDVTESNKMVYCGRHSTLWTRVSSAWLFFGLQFKHSMKYFSVLFQVPVLIMFHTIILVFISPFLSSIFCLLNLLTFISIPSLFVPEPCSSLPISTNCAYSRIAKSTDKGRKCCYVNIIHLPASWLLEHITRSEYTESCKFNVA